MTVKETKLEGCFILEPKIFNDKRGLFFESFNQNIFNQILGKEMNFVQDNESFSTEGVLRGLHYQTGKFAQAKLVRVIKGAVLDVAVDIRRHSPSYSQHITVKLTEDNKRQLFIPRGYAHGFIVLSETAIFSYKCDNFYNRESEGGINFNDPKLNIDWQLSYDKIVVSEKDLALPNLVNAKL